MPKYIYYKSTIYFYLVLLILLILTPCFFLVSCNKNINSQNIKLYNTKTNTIESINIEEYIQGVVAGEINNNSPIEALKAQAVLARTFTYYFLRNNKSIYKNADISTDITEAQAYNPELINKNIKKAVSETSGKVIMYNDNLINALFHSNSGGQTALTMEGLNIPNNNYPYIKSVKTYENSTNSTNYEWSQSFTKNEILETLRKMNLSISNISSFNKGEISDSGRCLTFIIGGREVSANNFRLNIGSTKLKSTLIDSIVINNDFITFYGRGYGHGVGLSQEYCIILANEGKNYKDIIKYFFNDVSIVDK